MNTLKELIKNSFHNFNEKFSLLKNDVFYTVEIQYDLNVEYSDPEIIKGFLMNCRIGILKKTSCRPFSSKK